jgi:hypothetical protein
MGIFNDLVTKYRLTTRLNEPSVLACQGDQARRRRQMTNTFTTRTFPASISARVSDLIPASCRSVKIWTVETSKVFPDGGVLNTTDGSTRCQGQAHKSEISALRRAIRIARDEAATAHIR